MALFKLTPLTRLTMAFDAELEVAKDVALEARLADKYLSRLVEAAGRRDAALRATVILDALLAMAVSGRNVKIPGTDLSTTDIPALLEILVGVSSAAVYLFTFSFSNWLCYSQIYSIFNERQARRLGLDPDLINFAETSSEPTIKLFRSKLNIWGEDWHTPGAAFRYFATFYGAAVVLFFITAPMLHFALIVVGLQQIYHGSSIGFTYVLFYAGVALTSILAVLTWLVPSVPFSFTMEQKQR